MISSKIKKIWTMLFMVDLYLDRNTETPAATYNLNVDIHTPQEHLRPNITLPAPRRQFWTTNAVRHKIPVEISKDLMVA